VVAREDNQGDKYLCAYLVSNINLDPAELKKFLSGKLPDHMIPSFFITIDKVPLTPNGKVNRAALPTPELKGGKNYSPPRDNTEEKLVMLWSEILTLNSENIGIDDHFFHLGGHSLKVTRLVSRIHKVFNVDIPIGEIFKKPSIREIAVFINNTNTTGANGKNFKVIEPVEKKKYYPLSSAQQRLFILSQVEGITTTYNMAGAMIIKGNLCRERFEKTFKNLLNRHESFRTSFHLMPEGPMQMVHEKVEFTVPYHEMMNAPVDNITADFVTPFDLSRAPLVRAQLIKINEQEHLVLFDMHHIISDGLSLGILASEFRVLYSGQSLPGPAEPGIQYKDYAHWQHRFFETGAMKNQELYWKKNFAGKIPILDMPMDFKRPGKRSFEGKTLTFTISAERTGLLNTLAQQHQVTLNILLFSIYALLISKYSDQKEVIIGLLAGGRKHADLESIIGMFVNFIPILCRLEPGHTFSESLNAARGTILEAYENQDYPFEKIVADLGLTSDQTRNPLFDTVFVFHEELLEAKLNTGMAELTFNRYPLAEQTSAVDFKIDVFPGPDSDLLGYLQYNTGLFKEESLRRLLFHFNNLIDILLADPGQKLADIKLFNPVEARQMRVKRQLNALDPGPLEPLSLAVSATFTAEPVSDYTRWWGRQFKWDIGIEFAPYNQVFQQLLDGAGLLAANKGINLVLVRFEDWIRDSSKPAEEKIRIVREHFDQLVEILRKKQEGSPYFVGIFPTATHLDLGETVTAYLQELTQHWAEVLAAMDNIYAVDFTRLQELYRIPEVFDPATDREGHLPFTQEYYAAMGAYIARKICALKHPPYKVIALDCDNTLWQGICGEDGPTGVKVEQPYLELQKFMLQKYHEGMLLVLCSKNNEADAWEVFEKNPGMLLKKEHFVDWRIDWNPKSANLRQLAAQLNLGIDSFIFVDDSSVECLEVESNCPEVFTLHLPDKPLEIPAFLNHTWVFDHLKVTDEDKNRSIMYIAEQKRQEIKKQVTTLDEFLENLELKVKLRLMETNDIPRVSQLTQRTNQFNLSTIRRTEAEIKHLSTEPGIACRVVEVTDRFGDYGLTGVVITKEETEQLFIDTFLLSCRVLGRKVEPILLANLKQYCEAKDIPVITARFYPTNKNKPIREFLEKYPADKVTGEGNYIDYRLMTAQMVEINRSESLPVQTDTQTDTVEAGVKNGTGKENEEWKKNGENKTGAAAIENALFLHQQFLYAAQQNTVEKLMQLPVYSLNQGMAKPREKEYVAPRSGTERKLHAIWEKTLNIKNPGIHDNFFELGGNSLKAVMLNEQIKKEFNLNFSSVLVYENRTIAAQMRFVEGKLHKTEVILDEEDLTLIKNRAANNRLKRKIKREVNV
ncbi:MAG: HAD-IIIC family phosphatase, partial [Acidobacteria bacterium]|nr:HAD-IIIC family phosphatase [Acidobacteriota bacterium]